MQRYGLSMSRLNRTKISGARYPRLRSCHPSPFSGAPFLPGAHKSYHTVISCTVCASSYCIQEASPWWGTAFRIVSYIGGVGVVLGGFRWDGRMFKLWIVDGKVCTVFPSDDSRWVTAQFVMVVGSYSRWDGRAFFPADGN